MNPNDKPPPGIAIAFHVSSFEALDRQRNYEAISADPEDYQRCIARERTLEMDACDAAGVPYFLILDAPDKRSVHISGYGAQHTIGNHLLYDSRRNPVASLRDHTILLRSSVSHERSILDFIALNGGILIADWPSQLQTLEWYRHVLPAYLKRQLAWFPLEGIFEQDLSTFKDKAGRFFCKTNFKIVGCSGVTNNLVAFFGYDIEMMSSTTDVLISEVIPLKTDSKGKCEYRCFVVGNRVSSISRYIDYDTDYEIPADLSAFAAAFAKDHIGRLPACYILDVAETTDRGPVVIELNGIVASGRYEHNSFPQLLNDLIREYQR